MKIDKILCEMQSLCNAYIDGCDSHITKSLRENRVTLLDLLDKEITDHIVPKTWGVYVFYVKFQEDVHTFERLQELWETNSEGLKLHSPSTIKKRFQKLDKGTEYCLYVGKSQNLKGRIAQHINQTTKYTTYGLKLSEHDRIIPKCELSFSFHAMKLDPKENIDAMKCLLVTLEKHMRDSLMPVIGKQ